MGYAAKFSLRYKVKLYALAIEGNHVQGPALFPEGNRSNFMRDLNSCIARAVKRHTPTYPGGRFWARRYSAEFLPGAEDIEEYFFYTVLQPVQDGLVEKISDYPGYNCFHDAIFGLKRRFKIVRWAEYNTAKRYNRRISIRDFSEVVTLEYARLPGYESLSQKEYAKIMLQKLEIRRRAIIEKRYQQKLGFAGKKKLLNTRPGTVPKKTKKSTIESHRPRVLSVCDKRRGECKAWYFSIYFSYKEASKKYRSGKLDTIFPDGTYRPYLAFHSSS